MMIVNLDTLPLTAWRDALSAAIGPTGEQRDLLLFVHGFQNSFTDAMVRAAQIAHDIGFQGTVASFDWASLNEFKRYTVDANIAEASSTQLIEFLNELSKQHTLGRVIVVAHSMGTRLVSYALRDLSATWPHLTIDQVVFAASDIDSA